MADAASDSARKGRLSARDVLIDAAEHLFGTIGFDGVSTRQILDFAGQKNQSALQYHFGGRSGLIWAVLDARLSAIEQSRKLLTKQLPSAGKESPEDLANLIIRPLAEFVDRDARGSAFVQFNIQTLHRPGEGATQVIESGDYPAMKEMFDRLEAHLAHLRDEERPLRRRMIITTAIGSVASWDATCRDNVSLEEFLPSAVAATSAIIRLS